MGIEHHLKAKWLLPRIFLAAVISFAFFTHGAMYVYPPNWSLVPPVSTNAFLTLMAGVFLLIWAIEWVYEHS